MTHESKPARSGAPEKPLEDRPFGVLRGIMEIVGDIESPVIPFEDWELLFESSIDY